MKNFNLLFLTLFASTFLAAQNSCDEAVTVAAGLHTVDTIVGMNAPQQLCLASNTIGDNGAWYTYQPTDTFTVTITTELPQNFGGDTRIHVYTGQCDDLTCVTGNDDVDVGTGNFLSEATFIAFPEFSYTIAFDDRWASDGFDFEILEDDFILPPPPPPALFSFTELLHNIPGTRHALVDMNGDYRDDILHVQGNNVHVGIWTDQGLSSMTLPTVTPDNSPSWSLAVGDVDANGFNDLVYGGGSSATILLRSDDGLSFDQKYSDETENPGFFLFSQRSNMVDINNDGMLDVFVCHDVEPNTYFINNGDDTFDFIQGGLGDTGGGGNYGSIWTDYDNDGDIDMFIAKCRGGNEVVSLNQMHRNNGDGTFTEVAEEIGLSDPIQTWSSAWADFDNDGDMDVFVGASNFQFGPHKYMMNMGDGTFQDMTDITGLAALENTSVEWGAFDMDNDGLVDIIGAGTIIKNMGDGSYVPQQMGFNTTTAIGDLNNDGFLDVISGSGTVQLNDGNDNNYVIVNAQGVGSNYNGIGARVIVETASGSQIRDIRSGEGFRSNASLNAHFGLGDDEAIESITINWPSGTVDVIENPAINTSVFVEEGTFPLLSTDDVNTTSLAVYPNPVENDLFINAGGQNVMGARYDVFDVQGKQVDSGILNTTSLDVSSLQSGNYILQLVIQEATLESKFYKK